MLTASRFRIDELARVLFRIRITRDSLKIRLDSFEEPIMLLLIADDSYGIYR